MSNSEYRTSGGVELTDELIARLAGEAEEGYDVRRLRPLSRRGRPPIGSDCSVYTVQVAGQTGTEEAFQSDREALAHVASLAMLQGLPVTLSTPDGASWVFSATQMRRPTGVPHPVGG